MSQVEGLPQGPDPASIFAALGDRTRRSLLHKLSDGQMRSIAKLSADTSITRQAITKHLRVLEEAGLVRSSRVGRESRFSLRPEPIGAARSYLDEVAAQWDDALERYYAEHDEILTDASARSAAMILVDEAPEGEKGVWRVRQIIADPAQAAATCR